MTSDSFVGPIAPHGGRLVNRCDDALDEGGLPRITLSVRQRADLDLIAVGAMSPLEGFMDRATYESVLTDMRLPSGLAWPIPITLAGPDVKLSEVAAADQVELVDAQGNFVGVMDVTDRYTTDPQREARLVYGTDDPAHPGVASLYEHGTTCLAGPVRVTRRMELEPGAGERLLDPAIARARFAERGWSRVVGFQTRNPIHRAHEYITKVALETVDGLFLQPLVGATKSDDVPATVRMRCYEILMEHYYPADRVVLGVLPAAMRYAGPREAILHALMRQNYGCTHFIVGRDHAGVGDYYGTYDAQKIFTGITREELAIQPVFFEHAFWCTVTGGMATTKTSPSAPEQRIFLSGTKVREMLRNGDAPPPEFTRPEVARELVAAYRNGI